MRRNHLKESGIEFAMLSRSCNNSPSQSLPHPLSPSLSLPLSYTHSRPPDLDTVPVSLSPASLRPSVRPTVPRSLAPSLSLTLSLALALSVSLPLSLTHSDAISPPSSDPPSAACIRENAPPHRPHPPGCTDPSCSRCPAGQPSWSPST